jgi:alpha-galactosidase
VNALDLTLPTSEAAEPVLSLHYSRGTNVDGEHLPGADDLQPVQTSLRPGDRRRFVPYGGRPSDKVLPFFNLAEAGDRSGLFLGIGWTGEWAATFLRNDAGATSLFAGIRQMRASLQPGEEIRTPSILLMAWRGNDSADGHNQFRRLLLEHFTPRLGGKPVVPPISAGPHAIIPFEKTTEANLLECIANISEHDLPVDNFWLDAGWYTCPQDPSGWDKTTGTWTPDPERFPRGLRPIADAAKQHGMDFLVWFEPERVMPKTWLADNHPDWLLQPADLLPERRYQSDDNFRLLDFGNPAALAWAKSYFSNFVREQGVTIFRMDSNLHTVLFWQNNEPPDRVGMRETRHVMGLYDFWDTLVAENPGLKLDVCSGTGSRIDFEVMRRSMNLTRTDSAWWKPVPDQAKTIGHAPWSPHTGIGAVSDAAYDFRSGLGAVFCANFNYLSKNEADWQRWKTLLAQVNSLRETYCGDFYALTGWSLAEEDVAAWQYHRSDLGKALVQVFRRSKASMPADGYTFPLRGLDPKAAYKIEDLDNPDESKQMTGAELMEGGLNVALPQQPQSALFVLHKLP